MEHIVFRNEENGYTVLNLTAESGEITCVGNFQAVHEGEYLEAEGEYTTHAAYGQQFRAETYRIKIPESGLALERYLGSGALKGIECPGSPDRPPLRGGHPEDYGGGAGAAVRDQGNQ